MPVIVGIFPIGSGWTLREEYPLVQSRCSYSVVDVYTIAEVVQDYYSNAPINRDVEYVFPLPPSAAVCSFKAVIDSEKVIKGIVKEKLEAKKAYEQAVSQGKTAGLLQQEHADVFRVSLGNIKPKTKISVHISFVSIIPHDGSSPQTLRITMPTAIAPRYGSAPTNIPWLRNNAQNRFELSVSVQMNKPITSISSPSHPIGLTLGCHQRELSGDYEASKAFVYLGDSAMLDKDIVIVISAQGMDTPRCSAERWLKSEGGEETTDAYALTLVPKFELPALPNQEYIFLVDRSGSMGGGRITAAKAALQILLRSLPSRGTSFNIVSFGSRYSSLWPTSQTYSSESMEQASKHVDGFEANYGGTELRSAIEFAFNSRQDIKAGSNDKSDKTPTSVFVLTDGEAWDLDGIINSINLNCGNAKKSGGLLRTFTLGVGNQVSTAMCEGIARAGQGTAVFVAEGEKPDTKLMGLLKAARGGVIEDLGVDWGDSEDATEKDDDFEMIPSFKDDDNLESNTSPPSQSQPPLCLFDESHVETPAEVGAQKAIFLLGPPPKVQQAPKSDKLPIPLYPGFRCSIFAIVKRCANPGPHTASVKITGKVLGREVVLQVPVLPVSVHSGIVEGKVDGGKLLHTLAAKALIQVFEDMAKTPENKAQIERLGTRYSLASSATSFVAIDEDTKDEMQGDEYNVDEQEKKMSRDRDRDRERENDLRLSTSMGSASIMWSTSVSPPTRFHPARRVLRVQSPSSSDDGDYDRDYEEKVASESCASDSRRGFGGLQAMVIHTPVASPVPPSSPLMAEPSRAQNLSVESIARAQNFNSSFPYDDNHLQFIVGADGISRARELPTTLKQLGGMSNAQEAIKMLIWATVITFVCLQKKFGREKDSWEMLAEKAKEYIEKELVELGLEETLVAKTVNELESVASALF